VVSFARREVIKAPLVLAFFVIYDSALSICMIFRVVALQSTKMPSR
jgi:hypothetical protein